VPTRPKSARFYTTIVIVWFMLTITLFYTSSDSLALTLRANLWIGLLSLGLLLCIAYFWLNGIKDMAYTLYYHLRLRTRLKVPRRRRWPGQKPHVVMVYCTRNDFNPRSLFSCLRQTYGNLRTVILDDSDKPEFIRDVDVFAAALGVEVVRRTDRAGFKAGNLNNFLGHGGFDYFVLLDSDEVVPHNFIDRCLDYFLNPVVGIVQANHRATRNRNSFMKMFSPGVDSHWLTYQAVKDRYGFMSLLGHGAMVSRDCYEGAGGFPHMVAEDIGFSLSARRAGYLTVFASDVVCEEEFPVDYLAFKKRHRKWTEGNMEFIKKWTWGILRMPMPWFEKLDIVLFTYSLPLTAFFFVFVVVNAIVLPASGYAIRYPLWMLAPTATFLVAPMLNDIIVLRRKLGLRRLLSYLVHSTLLFGSMYFVSLQASIKSSIGASVFHVTPKDTSAASIRGAIRAHAVEFGLAFALGAVVIWASGSIFPVLLLAAPTTFIAYLTVFNGRSEPDVFRTESATIVHYVPTAEP
jgi:cellulose synthase/poly-beta-1,6-N-acetylglucosamine synthase-like glycosyltransferase